MVVIVVLSFPSSRFILTIRLEGAEVEGIAEVKVMVVVVEVGVAELRSGRDLFGVFLHA